jgi:hypothetical protein
MKPSEYDGRVPEPPYECHGCKELGVRIADLEDIIRKLAGGVADLQRQVKADINASNVLDNFEWQEKWTPLTLTTIGGMHKAIKEAGL